MSIKKIYDIQPGLSSQTTCAVEEIVAQDSLSLRFFDINAPTIETSEKNIWDITANQILQEHKDLWARLAVL